MEGERADTSCRKRGLSEKDEEIDEKTRKASKRTRFARKEAEREQLEPMNVAYKVVDGIRYLEPYWSPWRTRTKGRWIGRKLVDCFAQEFLSSHRHYAKVALKLGRIYVNGEQITDVDFVLKNGDSIEHWGHRHEHPILDCDVGIIANTDDLLVVNKPASVPVHPCGQYSLNTVLGLLRREHGITGLRVLHRLDRTTSGILLLAKNYDTDLRFKTTLKDGHWRKEYVCMLEGELPDGDVKCDQPIGNLVVSMGIQCVREDGKEARTTFRKMWSDKKVTVAKALIDTGRTHQIRVHAQYLGYPIVGDQIYNSTAFGEQKGRLAQYGLPFEELAQLVRDSHKLANWLEEVQPGYEELMQKLADEPVEAETPHLPVEMRPAHDAICLSCNVTKKPPTMAHFSMYLHCLKYETDDWAFETPLPAWAVEPSIAEPKAS